MLECHKRLMFTPKVLVNKLYDASLSFEDFRMQIENF